MTNLIFLKIIQVMKIPRYSKFPAVQDVTQIKGITLINHTLNKLYTCGWWAALTLTKWNKVVIELF